MNRPVNFELAKLLKEKGFEQENPGYEDHKYSFYAIKDFDNDWRDSFSKRREGELLDGYYLAPLTEKRENVVIIAPTITEVIMWFYEKHGIWIVSLPVSKNKWYFEILYNYKKDIGWVCMNDSTESNSPSEAYEAAIKYTLNNLI